MRQLLDTLAEVKEPVAQSTSPRSEEKSVKPATKGGKSNASTSPVKTSPHVPRIIRKVR